MKYGQEYETLMPCRHCAFTDSHIENDEPGDKVGSIRNFNFKDGGNIRERVLALSDVKHLCTYTILESPLPLENYVATLRLVPITDANRTYAEWTAEFNCRLEEEDGLVKTIGDSVFQGGFDALKTAFAG